MLDYFGNGKTVFLIVITWLLGSAMIFNFGPSRKLETWKGGIFFYMNVAYSNQEGVDAIGSLGEQGRSLYHKHLRIFDPIFMLLQLAGITALFFYATSKFEWSRGWFRIIVLTVVLVTVLDMIENVIVDRTISAFPNTLEAQVGQMRSITSLKRNCLPVLMIPLVVSAGLLIACLVRKILISKNIDESMD